MVAIYNFLRTLLPGGPIYVRIKADELHVRDVTTGREWKDIPEVAIRPASSPVVLAVGSLAAEAAAREPGVLTVINGYQHPRTIIADFNVAEKVLQYALNSIYGRGWFQPPSILVMHPLQRLEGGLTGVEERALLELAAGVGARRSYVWVGRELADPEVKDESIFRQQN